MQSKTLHDLLKDDAESRRLYDQLAPDVQTALQEQRQNIHTREELKNVAAGFAKRTNQ